MLCCYVYQLCCNRLLKTLDNEIMKICIMHVLFYKTIILLKYLFTKCLHALKYTKVQIITYWRRKWDSNVRVQTQQQI